MYTAPHEGIHTAKCIINKYIIYKIYKTYEIYEMYKMQKLQMVCNSERNIFDILANYKYMYIYIYIYTYIYIYITIRLNETLKRDRYTRQLDGMVK